MGGVRDAVGQKHSSEGRQRVQPKAANVHVLATAVVRQETLVQMGAM